MAWHGKFRPDPMVPKGVWYYMATLAPSNHPARNWHTKTWINHFGPAHPQLEFRGREGELWARWLVGVDEERETIWRVWS
jgi:hypothetical protein